MPKFLAVLRASMFAPRKMNSQPYFCFWRSIICFTCSAVYLWLEFS